jgi:hypothetical protein
LERARIHRAGWSSKVFRGSMHGRPWAGLLACVWLRNWGLGTPATHCRLSRRRQLPVRRSARPGRAESSTAPAPILPLL